MYFKVALIILLTLIVLLVFLFNDVSTIYISKESIIIYFK